MIRALLYRRKAEALCLETTLAMLCELGLVAAALAALRHRTAVRYAVVGATAALAVLARVDAVILVAGSGAAARAIQGGDVDPFGRRALAYVGSSALTGPFGPWIDRRTQIVTDLARWLGVRSARLPELVVNQLAWPGDPPPPPARDDELPVQE